MLYIYMCYIYICREIHEGNHVNGEIKPRDTRIPVHQRFDARLHTDIAPPRAAVKYLRARSNLNLREFFTRVENDYCSIYYIYLSLFRLYRHVALLHCHRSIFYDSEIRIPVSWNLKS